MFYSPLNERLPEKTLEEDLIVLYDNITEFCDYCSFLCDSFASIVAREEEIDDTTVRGISRCSDWMKNRVEEIKDEVGQIHKKMAYKNK